MTVKGDYTFYVFKCLDETVTSLYVGQSIDFERRKKDHSNTYRLFAQGKLPDIRMKLYPTIERNGGFNNWVCVPIETAQLTPREADQRERYWIEGLKADINTSIPYLTREEFYAMTVKRWFDPDPPFPDPDKDSVSTLEEFHALKVAKREVRYERRETALIVKVTRPLVERAIRQLTNDERVQRRYFGEWVKRSIKERRKVMRVQRKYIRAWVKLVDQERRKVIRSIVRRWLKQMRDPAKGLELDI
jgi:hypothetical protein